MFQLLAQEVPAATARGPQVRHAVGTEASVRLRAGDLAAVAVYDRYGQIRGADEDAAATHNRSLNA
jgi:hypothetical protein